MTVAKNCREEKYKKACAWILHGKPGTPMPSLTSEKAETKPEVKKNEVHVKKEAPKPKP
jgi:hypothetical protein